MSTVSRQSRLSDIGTKSVWAGRILTGLAIAFFVMDGVMKLIQPQVVIDATSEIGWPEPTQGRSLSLGSCCWLVRAYTHSQRLLFSVQFS